jgi:type I restriction enzyme S subunit
MYYILKKLEPEWSKQGQTGSQMNLNTELINTTLVLIPQLQEEQTAIAAILSDMDSDISSLQQRLTKTRQIKQGMMQQLLTGQIRLI